MPHYPYKWPFFPLTTHSVDLCRFLLANFNTILLPYISIPFSFCHSCIIMCFSCLGNAVELKRMYDSRSIDHDMTRVDMYDGVCGCGFSQWGLWTSAKTQRSSNQRWVHSSLWHNIEQTNTNGLKKAFFSSSCHPLNASCVFGHVIFITRRVVWISEAF